MNQPMRPDWTSSQALDAVRPQVRGLLTAIPAFGALSAEEQRALAANMVKVLSYISDPHAIAQEVSTMPASHESLSRAQDDAVEATKASLSKSPGMVGKDFKAGAVREGVDQFGALVKKVDFPKFVGGLIKNVFQAIVESSIEQMRAYGELIANVSKTVDAFMQDNISAGAGRDWLAQKYPDAIGVEVNQTAGAFEEGPIPVAPTATLVTRGENAEVRLAEISRDLNLTPPVSDITDADAELRLVTAARLQMAKSRQQLLASMVMLGINRIVVTDGAITAKVIFDMRAEDRARRNYTASMYDEESQRAKQSLNASYGGWMSPIDASVSAEAEQAHVATVGSSVDETSESKAEVKAKLSGEVRVNFKSDYLPLEKMATPEMMSTIQGNSTPYNPNNSGASRSTSGTQP
ncbi:hypothetical protein [Burkholderia sp. Ac-20365]|uniref:hypothetical protein n=1 Tax=Burkholderia sp. Ac-20365 TaxID=2703897 RepID=UPI00197B8D6D|nr:hypothetical protein [Burkholderia sp. Ac-20365]MBN3760742.1 hypothetical protein [Burkholderia sp. Ac-20365]